MVQGFKLSSPETLILHKVPFRRRIAPLTVPDSLASGKVRASMMVTDVVWPKAT